MARQPHDLPPRSSTRRETAACKKPTSKSTHFKRPAVTEEQQGSKSKKIKGKSSVDKAGWSSDEKVDKKSQTNDADDSEIEDKKVGAALFTRLFTEKDEIVLLEGMIDYKEKKGADPSSNMVAFHKSVKGSLSCRASRKQIVDKISKLKRKFMRKGRNGEDPVISKPHDYKLFELSENIWGYCEVRGTGDSRVRKDNKDDNVGGSKTLFKSKESDVMDKTEAETEYYCWSLYPCLCASLESEAIKTFTAPMSPKDYVNKVVSGLDKDKARELEQEWKGFVFMEQKVYAKRAEMLSKQAELAAAMNP